MLAWEFRSLSALLKSLLGQSPFGVDDGEEVEGRVGGCGGGEGAPAAGVEGVDVERDEDEAGGDEHFGGIGLGGLK